MNGARARESPDGVAHWMTPSGEFHGATLTRCDLELRCTGSAVRRLLRNGRSTAVPFGAAVSDSGKALRRTQRSGLEGACGGEGPTHIPFAGGYSSARGAGGARFRFSQLRGSFVAHAVGKGTCPGRNRTPPALGVGIHHRGPALDLAFGDATAPVDKAR